MQWYVQYFEEAAAQPCNICSAGFPMAHFEAKNHTLTVERMKTRFKISKTFKNPAKVTNGQIMARKNRQKLVFGAFKLI